MNKVLFFLVSLFFISFSLASMEKEKQKKLPDKIVSTCYLNALPAEIRALIFERYLTSLTLENARQVFPTLSYLSKWIPEIKIAGKRWKWKDYFYRRLAQLATWNVQPHWKLVFDARKQKKKLSEIEEAIISPDQQKIIMTPAIETHFIVLNTTDNKMTRIDQRNIATHCQFNQPGTLFAFETNNSIRIHNNKDNKYITSIPIKRDHGFESFAFVNNNIYVAKGSNIEIYSPKENLSEWTKIQTIKSKSQDTRDFSILTSRYGHIYTGNKNVYRIDQSENDYKKIIPKYKLLDYIEKILVSPDQQTIIVKSWTLPFFGLNEQRFFLWDKPSQKCSKIPLRVGGMPINPISLINKNTLIDSNLNLLVITKKEDKGQLNFQVMNQFYYPKYGSRTYFDFCNDDNKFHIIIRKFKKKGIEQLSKLYVSDFSEQEPLKNRIKVEDWFRQKKYQILQKLLQKKEVDQPLKEYVKHRLITEQATKKQSSTST